MIIDREELVLLKDILAFGDGLLIGIGRKGKRKPIDQLPPAARYYIKNDVNPRLDRKHDSET
jgi:hypothetical protein